jgi:hypothetical protein
MKGIYWIQQLVTLYIWQIVIMATELNGRKIWAVSVLFSSEIEGVASPRGKRRGKRISVASVKIQSVCYLPFKSHVFILCSICVQQFVYSL